MGIFPYGFKSHPAQMFKLISEFKPTGDQPRAIRKLVNNLKKGYRFQTLLGITGSGKTYTMAEVIKRIQRPALIISPNKTLAAQLYHEFKTFFPFNAVHYFVSYYDYYQPEAYIPETDTYIAKDARINEFLDQLRHATLQSALTRRDFIIVSSVSCIYGIGDPEEYEKMGLELKIGDFVKLKDLKEGLKILQYEKLSNEIKTGSFRLSKNLAEIILPDGNDLIELYMDKNKIKEIRRYPILKKFNGKFSLVIKRDNFSNLDKIKFYPAKFFVTEKGKLDLAIINIKRELSNRYWELLREGKIIEAERLRRRTLYDIRLLETRGYCPGIENYSRHLSFRKEGEPPYTILDYLPKDTIIFIDESHLTIPQLKAMSIGDRRRKLSLIEYGWRLPSALDNRPLTLEEFLDKNFQIIFVSATPKKFERKMSIEIVEQLIRPTFIPDPQIEVRPTKNQIIDLLKEIKKRVEKKERVLILTLTKRSAENLTEFLLNYGFNVDYLHSDIKTLKRPGIIRKLRNGEIDILIGINLLREGLDLPEVSLVCILDADKEGFLRNSVTLIQAIGRASRNINGKVILYADKITKSMEEAIKETERRRRYQLEYNKKYNIKPRPIIKEMPITLLEEFEKREEEITKEELLIFLETEKNNL